MESDLAQLHQPPSAVHCFADTAMSTWVPAACPAAGLRQPERKEAGLRVDVCPVAHALAAAAWHKHPNTILVLRS